MPKKVIARMKGGLGNQLFCYAAARRLALVNNAELVIDHHTAFVRDRTYRRSYALDRFNIAARKARPSERMEPFEHYRRKAAKFFWRQRPFHKRRYIEQIGRDFDRRLLDVEVSGTTYLDGYWQSELYFKDVEFIIRKDLRIIPPEDPANREVAEFIGTSNAVAVHVRWFRPPASRSTSRNLTADYYSKSVSNIKKTVENPHFFLFSEYPIESKEIVNLPNSNTTFITHNRGDESAYADLWLMSLCKFFIIANSTFSWWGAWLANHESKIVIAPSLDIPGRTFQKLHAQIPNVWKLV